ncbi:MAG: STAS domain-containing protein [Actinomycetota bacterium]|nr:STAS domain-containing protein [Actinomycetota bacterium]
MSGVVFLPPRPKPKQRNLQSAVARLSSLLHRAPRRGHDNARGPDNAIGKPSDELRVRCRRSRGQPIVEVAGKLNERTRDALVEALEESLEDDAGQIVLDLGELESIDHAGLDAVLTAHLRASDQLKIILIFPGSWPVQRVFDDAQVPFLYTSGRGGRVAGRARSRGRRTGLSTRPGRPEPRPRSIRRSP